MREKSFRYNSFSELEKNKTLLDDIICNAKILNSGDAYILKAKDFYLNQEEDGLYFVAKVENGGLPSMRIEVIPLRTTNPKKKFQRTTDYIRGGTISWIVKVVDVKKIL